MKRYINSANYIESVTEPSASEYGRFLSEANKRMQDRYAPFKLKATYFCRGRSNSTGYRIQLGSDEWIADNGGEDSWNSDYGYELYGAFNIDEIKSWSELFRYKPLVNTKFKTIDSVMTYLFNNVDTDLEARYEDAKRSVESGVAKRKANVTKVEEGTDFISYEGPDGDIFDFDLTESEYDIDIQLESFSMWCLDNGAMTLK